MSYPVDLPDYETLLPLLECFGDVECENAMILSCRAWLAGAADVTELHIDRLPAGRALEVGLALGWLFGCAASNGRTAVEIYDFALDVEDD